MQAISRHLLFTLAALALLSACATPITATTDYDRQYDFSSVRKIAIQPINRANPAMVVISDMQVERIAQALTDELQRRGYEVVADNEDADVFLQWHLVTQEQLDVRSFNSATYYNCWSCGVGADVSVRQYTQGTFIVDLVDPLRLRSVWRAEIESRMRSQADPQKAAEFRREAAQAIFAQFPPN
ncbi:MAG: hypothetical protein CME59_05960 [Halioglobus sp.]|mgnify:CR=1 FL=1|nr:hypothetical protein [Halioglobus sp.]